MIPVFLVLSMGNDRIQAILERAASSRDLVDLIQPVFDEQLRNTTSSAALNDHQ